MNDEKSWIVEKFWHFSVSPSKPSFNEPNLILTFNLRNTTKQYAFNHKRNTVNIQTQC